MARSGNWITAGDGLVAFGAALILAVQTHWMTSRTPAGQWIYAKPRHARKDLQLISRPARFSTECPASRAAARGNLEPSPSPSTRAKARPPQPRESSSACHPNTGPGAEGGGGWPMHATAQPWHAEGRPSPTGALRCLLSPRELPGTPPAARPGGCHGSSPGPPWQHAPCQDAPCAPDRRWPAPAPSRRS